MTDNNRTKQITAAAMLCAVAYVSTLIAHFIPFAMLGFLKYDPKDIIIAIGAFLFGPVTAVLISVTVSFIELVTISTTGIIGFIMNVIATCAFCLPAALVYAKKRTISGAAIGLVSGTLMMTAMMLLWNYLITPLYLNVPRSDVADMLVSIFLPFNLIKGGLNMAGTLMLYRPISTALRRTGLAPPSTSKQTGKSSFSTTVIVLIASIALIGLCVIMILRLR